MSLSEKDKAIRQRLKDDFPHYAEKCLKIRTKEGEILPFVLNKTQQLLHAAAENQLKETGSVRIIIVKGRQQGCSTYIGGRGYHKTTHTKGLRTFILTHEQEATDNLFDMVQRFHQNNHPAMKPSTDASNAKELSFGSLDSGYRVGTAGTKGKGRSSTIQFFHGSEVGYWPHAETHAAGVLQAVPNAPGTEVWLESTGNGIGNYFHQQWQMAESGLSGFIPVFIPWFIQDEYQLPVPEEFTYDDEEHEYAEIYSLIDAQVAWRRAKIMELHGDPQLFRQEYPATPQEAFQAGEENIYIPANLIQSARKGKQEGVGAKVLGVDVARFGDDRSAICYRQGRKVYWVRSYEKQDLMALAGLVKRAIDEIEPDATFVDVIGVGAGVLDRLNEMGIPNVYGAQASEKALDVDAYINRRAEMYGCIKDWLREGADIPDEDSLASDLGSVKFKYDSRGRIQLEKKEDSKARGVRSPDLGDSLALTFFRPVALAAIDAAVHEISFRGYSDLG